MIDVIVIIVTIFAGVGLVTGLVWLADNWDGLRRDKGAKAGLAAAEAENQALRELVAWIKDEAGKVSDVDPIAAMFLRRIAASEKTETTVRFIQPDGKKK